MAQQTYRARVIVLQKTKLGETDLILTLLAEDGSQIRAVAKGARRPSSPFSSRLELYSQAQVLLAAGRSLDIVKEAQIIESNAELRHDMEHAAAAAPLAELLNKVTQLGLVSPQVFLLTQVCLSAIGKASPTGALVITAAHLLKAVSFSGFRPSLSRCARCGNPIDYCVADVKTAVSYTEGGVICKACAPSSDVVLLSTQTCNWARVFLHTTIDDIAAMQVAPGAALAVLHFCQPWIKEHIGLNLKSLNFLFTCGLF
ncbi:MAG: DNA repair protein RecO [Raoultibacter sp.]